MATTLTIERDNIIKAALRRIGVLAVGDTPSASEITDAAETLNSIVKSYDAAPWFKWFIESTPKTFSTAASTESYALDATIKWVETMVVQESSVWSPVTLLTVGEYAGIQSRGVRTGIPTHAFISTDLLIPKAFLYPVPNGIFAVNYWARRKVDIFDNSADTGDLPPEWYNVLIWRLASELAFDYGRPLEKIQLISVELQRAEQLAMGNQVQQITGQEVFKPSFRLNSARENVERRLLEPQVMQPQRREES